MKRWGMVVCFLYVVVLVVVAGPLGMALFSDANPGDLYSAFKFEGVWIGLAVALVAQAALISVPVDLAQNRPITKRTIIPLVLASAFAMALLVAGGAFALTELFKYNFSYPTSAALGLFCVVWMIWALVFSRISRKAGAAGLVEKSRRWFLRGSILELLIAVPAHIIVRQRHECCGGLLTGAGIALGVAVMFFAFGPGVFYLIVERFRHLSRTKGI